MRHKRVALAPLAVAMMLAGSARGDEGKLVFADHPIRSEKDAGIKTTFKAGESIYGLILVGQRPYGDTPRVSIQWFLDGGEQGKYTFEWYVPADQSTAIPFELIDHPKTDTGKAREAIILQHLLELPAGPHTMTLSLYGYDGDPTILHLDLSTGKDKWTALAKSLAPPEADPAAVHMPKPGAHQALAAAFSAPAQSFLQKKPLRIVVTDYFASQDPNTHVPTHVAKAAVAVPDQGNLCTLYVVVLTQSRLNGGAWSKWDAGASDGQQQMLCKNAK